MLHLFSRDRPLDSGRADRLSQTLWGKWGEDKQWEALDAISVPGTGRWGKRLLIWQLGNENREMRDRAWEVLDRSEVDFDILVSELRCPMWQVRVGVIRLIAKTGRLDIVNLLAAGLEDYHQSVIDETRRCLDHLIADAIELKKNDRLPEEQVEKAMRVLSEPLYASKRSPRFQAIEFFIKSAPLDEDRFWSIYLSLELPQYTSLHEEFVRHRKEGALEIMYRGLLQLDEGVLERLTQFIATCVRNSGEDVNYHLNALRHMDREDFVRIAFVMQHYRILVEYQGLIKYMSPPERIVLFDLLEAVGAEQNLAFLHRCLELDDSRIRIRVLKILGESETLPLQKEVFQFLTETDEQVLLATLRYIRKKGDLSVLDKIGHLARSKRPKVKRGVMTTIYVILRDNLLQDFENIPRAKRDRILGQLVKMKPDFYDEVSYLGSSSDEKDRIKYIKILYTQELISALAEFQRLSRDPSPKVRATAIMGYRKIDDDAERYSLLEGFFSDNDPRVRANAIELLPQTNGTQKMVDILKRAAKSQFNRERANSLQKIISWGYKEFENELIKMLEEPDEWKKASALWVVANTGTPDLVPYLRRAANDPRGPVRQMAVRGIGKKGTEEDIRALMPFLQDPERGVRLAAQEALRSRLKMSFEIA
ncbi:MAG: HEAT repeat domain-containing protein [bacterium]